MRIPFYRFAGSTLDTFAARPFKCPHCKRTVVGETRTFCTHCRESFDDVADRWQGSPRNDVIDHDSCHWH